MKALKYIIFLLLILTIGAAIYIAVQPNSFEFNRSRVIKAPPEVLYKTVNDYKEWPKFSPWIEQDMNANLTYDEITTGKNAGYSWEVDDLGEGNMKTINANPYESISQQINFTKPFESSANIDWKFEPHENGTEVTWEMNGKQDFMTKMYVAFAGSIEENTAPDFERGLFKLDSLVKAKMAKFEISVDGVTQHSGGFYLYASASAKMSNLENKMAELMPKVSGFAKANNVTMAGNPFVMYHKWDVENNAVIFSCCVPTTTKVMASDSEILTGQITPFKAVKTTLKGNYENLRTAWDRAMDYIETNNLTQPEDPISIETYLNDPLSTPNPANLITEIYLEIE